MCDYFYCTFFFVCLIKYFSFFVLCGVTVLIEWYLMFFFVFSFADGTSDSSTSVSPPRIRKGK